MIITLEPDPEVELPSEITAMDLLILLNELRMAGAEAISINDQRIIHNSYVAYMGVRHIGVNRIRIIPPFTVKAIGNPTHLASSIEQRHHGFVDMMDLEGITVTVVRDENITIERIYSVI